MMSFTKIVAFLCLTFCSRLIQAQILKSPDGNLTLTFKLQDEGIPTYSLSYKNKQVIKTSNLGIETKDVESLASGFSLLKEERNSVNNSWNPIMGEQKTIINNYNELLLTL